MFDFADRSNITERFLYVYTNRNNLLQILSSGQLLPSLGYKKYYSDLSTSVDGHVLLFTNKVDHISLARLSEVETSYPVCIECLLPLMLGPVTIVDSDYVSRQGNLIDLRENDIAVAVTGAMSIRGCREVFFQEKSQLDEFLARTYANVDLALLPISADGGVFGHFEPDLGRLRSAIPVRSESIEITQKKCRDLDALWGVICAASHETHSKEQEDYALFFRYIASAFADMTYAGFGTVTQLLDKIFLDYEISNKALVPSIRELLPALICQHSTSQLRSGFKSIVDTFFENSDDTALLASTYLEFICIRTLLEADSNDIDPKKYLELVRKEYLETLQRAGRRPSEQLVERHSAAFQDAFDIVDALKSVYDIKQWSRDLRALKIFLLVLMRQDLHGTVSLRNELDDFGLSGRDAKDAMLWQSARLGYSEMPTTFKNLDIATQNAFDSCIMKMELGVSWPLALERMEVNRKKKKASQTFEVSSVKVIGFYGNSFEFEERDFHDRVIDLICSRPFPKNRKPLIDLCIQLGIPEAVQTVASFPIDCPTKEERGVLRVYCNGVPKIDMNLDPDILRDTISTGDWKLRVRQVPLSIKKKVERLYGHAKPA